MFLSRSEDRHVILMYHGFSIIMETILDNFVVREWGFFFKFYYFFVYETRLSFSVV